MTAAEQIVRLVVKSCYRKGEDREFAWKVVNGEAKGGERA